MLTEPVGQAPVGKPANRAAGCGRARIDMWSRTLRSNRHDLRSHAAPHHGWLTFALLASTLLPGCTVGPSWKTQSMWSPSSWFSSQHNIAAVPTPISTPVPEPINPNWWNIFKDPELTSLETRVAAANLNVRLATIRLAESRSQRQITGADQFPSLTGSGSYTRQEVSKKGVLSLFGGGSGSGSFASTASSANGTSGRSGGIPASVTGSSTSVPPFNLWQYGFDASWELDLWGRVRREVESSDASVEASADARRNALLSVVAEVARDYVQLRGIQTQLAIANDNIGTEQQSLQLTQARFRGGLTTELDVANASAQLQTTQSQVPQLQQQQASAINALSFLLGEAPNALQAELITPGTVPPVPPRVPVGIPSELARRRPDILQAEAQLHSATADIGVAVADFYPKVTLDGSFGLQALKAKDLGNWAARQYGLGPTISLPIFEGGRLRATLELRKVEQQEAALNYQQTVLQAWHDVDNALTAYGAEQRRHDSLEGAVAQNRRALDLSRQRYTQGVADFLDVLDSERALLSAQLQLADSSTTVSSNLVQLYKALGGGWEQTFPVQTAQRE